MIADLSRSQDLNRICSDSGLDQTEMGRWIMRHGWRYLVLLDLDSGVEPQAHCRGLAIERFGRGEMELSAESVWSLRQKGLAQWTDFAARGLARGLAYTGPLEHFPDSLEDRAALRIVTDLAATFENPKCWSTWSDPPSSWSPISIHTFDAAMLIYDQRRAAMLIVVDED
jgi:hypothetical protein